VCSKADIEASLIYRTVLNAEQNNGKKGEKQPLIMCMVPQV